MKKGTAIKFPEIVEILEPMLEKRGFTWFGFSTWWDVAIVKGEIRIIRAIHDLQQAEMVCAQKQMAEKVGADPGFTDEELGIVDSIESQFLDDIMTWQNYRDEWALTQDQDNKRILTKLIKRKPAQKVEITQDVIDEMIKKQLEEASGDPDVETARRNVTPVNHVVKILE
jgi:hypothetical protein